MSKSPGEARPGPQPLRLTLELLGDQWTLLIVQSVFLHVRRYEDIRKRLGISPTALSGRLADAVREGVLTRVPYQDHNRTRHEYHLTDNGLRLWQLLVSIWMWEREWIHDRAGSLPELIHLDCGRVISAPLGCLNCDKEVSLRDIEAVRRAEVPVSATTASTRFRRKDSARLATDPLLFFPTTMELLGDRWSSGLLVSAFLGAKHFSEFQRELGIAPSVLSARLGRLVELGVMRTATASTRTDARAYRLTDKGRAFFPALAFIVDYALARYPEHDPAVVLRHTACDLPLAPTLLCPYCAEPLRRRGVRVVIADAPE